MEPVATPGLRGPSPSRNRRARPLGVAITADPDPSVTPNYVDAVVDLAREAAAVGLGSARPHPALRTWRLLGELTRA
jgi:hypothetical protein